MRKFISQKRRGEAEGIRRGRSGRWANLISSMAAIISIVALISACSTGEPSANTSPGTTPTPIIGETPIADTEMTPPATIAPTATAVPTIVPTAAPTEAPVPTVAPPTVAPPTIASPTAAPPTAAPPPVNGKVVTVWIQVTDSCKQALPGGTFSVTDPNAHTTTTTAPTSGGGHQTIPTTEAGCPIQQGNCNTFTIGCTSANLNIPAKGTVTYKIAIAATAPGFGTNLKFAICEGGSDCRHGSEVASVQVSSNGSVSATVLNPYPDGATVTWPTNKPSYSGTRADPIMFHEFGIGDGSIQCDGDHDADDFLTGTPGSHCDSDGDKGK